MELLLGAPLTFLEITSSYGRSSREASASRPPPNVLVVKQRSHDPPKVELRVRLPARTPSACGAWTAESALSGNHCGRGRRVEATDCESVPSRFEPGRSPHAPEGSRESVPRGSRARGEHQGTWSIGREVETPACHAGNDGCESRMLRHFHVPLPPKVKAPTLDRMTMGAIPVRHTTLQPYLNAEDWPFKPRDVGSTPAGCTTPGRGKTAFRLPWEQETAGAAPAAQTTLLA